MENAKPKSIANVHVYFINGIYYVSAAVRNNHGFWVEQEPTIQPASLPKAIEEAYVSSKNNLATTSWKESQLRDSVDKFIYILWFDDASVKVETNLLQNTDKTKKIWYPDTSLTGLFSEPENFAVLAQEVQNRLSA